jgi:plasmid maintenance system antidote protein VapI
LKNLENDTLEDYSEELKKVWLNLKKFGMMKDVLKNLQIENDQEAIRYAQQILKKIKNLNLL